MIESRVKPKEEIAWLKLKSHDPILSRGREGFLFILDTENNIKKKQKKRL